MYSRAETCNAGGNQRETDRLKAQKKAAGSKSKPKESATSLAKRKEQYVPLPPLYRTMHIRSGRPRHTGMQKHSERSRRYVP